MGVFEDLTSGTSALVSGLLGESGTILGGITGLTGAGLDSIMESLLSFRYIMVYYFQEAINYATNIGSVMKDYIGEAISGIHSVISGVVSQLTSYIQGLVSSLSASILSTVNGLIGGVTDLITGVSDRLSGFTTLVDGLLTGINFRLTDIIGVLFNPEALIELIKSALAAVW